MSNDFLLADTYQIYGNTFSIRSTDERFLNLVRKHWNRFDVRKSASKPKIIFRIFKNEMNTRLKRKRTFFCNGNFLYYTDLKNHITGYFYKTPSLIYMQVSDFKDMNFLYYYLFEPVFLYLLKRLNLFQWRCAAVAKNGTGVYALANDTD